MDSNCSTECWYPQWNNIRGREGKGWVRGGEQEGSGRVRGGEQTGRGGGRADVDNVVKDWFGFRVFPLGCRDDLVCDVLKSRFLLLFFFCSYTNLLSVIYCNMLLILAFTVFFTVWKYWIYRHCMLWILCYPFFSSVSNERSVVFIILTRCVYEVWRFGFVFKVFR